LARAAPRCGRGSRNWPPDELNRVGFRLYEQFRPEVPERVKGWGAKGELDLDRVRQALF
jgi:hypothetical protein